MHYIGTIVLYLSTKPVKTVVNQNNDIRFTAVNRQLNIEILPVFVLHLHDCFFTQLFSSKSKIDPHKCP